MHYHVCLAIFAVINVVLTFIVHCTYKKAIIKHYKTNGAGNKVLVVTTMDRGTTLMEQLKLNLPWDAELVAACVMDSKEIEYDMNGRSELPTAPTVALQAESTLRVSPEGSLMTQ